MLCKNKNLFLLPPKVSIKLPNEGFFNTMPCVIDPYYSCKIVIRNINHHPSISGDILLYYITNSNLLCIMDCKWITSIRTGAVSLITTKYLSKPDFKDISLIGLGMCINAYMKCFLIEYPNQYQ